MNKNLKVLK